MMEFQASQTDMMRKYNPDQPRDDHGRFGSGLQGVHEGLTAKQIKGIFDRGPTDAVRGLLVEDKPTAWADANDWTHQAMAEELGLTPSEAYGSRSTLIAKKEFNELFEKDPHLDIEKWARENSWKSNLNIDALTRAARIRIVKMNRKYHSGVVAPNQSGLTDRQIRVVANSGKSDRVNDILVPKGCKLDNYQKNPVVLANHDPDYPIGNFAPEITGEGLAGVITFAPAGISHKADEFCGLYKAGVLNAVSVGFQDIEATPNKGGGMIYEQWELLEVSMVSVPCDPGAVVTARSFKGDSKVASWSCGASRNLPLNSDKSWDGPAAEKRIFEKAGFDGDKPDTAWAAKAFLAHDTDKPTEKGSYKLPIADVIDGRLTCLESGIKAAASRVSQADIGDDCKEKAQAVIDAYEKKFKIGDHAEESDSDKAAARMARIKTVKPKIKDLYAVAALANLLESLGWAQMTSDWESEMEGDGSKVPAMLGEALRVLASAFLAMSAEEVRELLAGADVIVDGEDDSLPLAAKKVRAIVKQVNFSTKEGRTLSAENAEHLATAQKCIKGISGHLETIAKCHAKAMEHCKDGEMALSALEPKPKPDKPDDSEPNDSEGANDTADTELSFEAEHRKRMADLLRLKGQAA